MKTIFPFMMTKKKMSSRSRLVRGVAALALLAPVSATLAAPSAIAQKAPVTRTVQGKVADGGDAAIKGAVVHLKDMRSLAQKSFITPEDGEYRFGQLNTNSDYEIWAEFGGKKSSVKSISSFDNKNTFTIALKIDK